MTVLPLLPAALAAVAGGVAVAVQAPINARLAAGLGGPLWAGAVSFAVGTFVLAVAALALARAPGAAEAASVPAWAWCGGALGALYVVAVIWTVPSLGVVTMVGALILGQMGAALALDAAGAFGLPVREIGAPRLAAALLVGAGVVLSRF